MHFIETRQVGLAQESAKYSNATKKTRTSNKIRSNALHNVIERRRRELTDLARGMNELSLIDYLKAHEEMPDYFTPQRETSGGEKVKSPPLKMQYNLAKM